MSIKFLSHLKLVEQILARMPGVRPRGVGGEDVVERRPGHVVQAGRVTRVAGHGAAGGVFVDAVKVGEILLEGGDGLAWRLQLVERLHRRQLADGLRQRWRRHKPRPRIISDAVERGAGRDVVWERRLGAHQLLRQWFWRRRQGSFGAAEAVCKGVSWRWRGTLGARRLTRGARQQRVLREVHCG